MRKQEIIDKVNAVVAAKAGIDAGEIKPEDSCDALCADSIQCIEALIEIEQAFGVSLPSERLIFVSTMQDAYDLVAQAIIGTFGFRVY